MLMLTPGSPILYCQNDNPTPLEHHAKLFYGSNIRTEVDLKISTPFDNENLTVLLRDLKKEVPLAYMTPIKRSLKLGKATNELTRVKMDASRAGCDYRSTAADG
jgi:hypothetical protein